MRMLNYTNKNCLSFKKENGRIENTTLLIVAKSGHGKGMSTESMVERWRMATGGIVIILHDPKQTSEFSFVQYEPKEPYHLKELRKDGISPKSHTCKMYHPFTFNLAKKGIIPEVNFYTIPIKSLTRDDWSILAETDAETEAIKILERTAENIKRNSSLFEFLLSAEKLTETKKDKKKMVRDKANWGLKVGGGTAKSIKQIGNMLSSFKRDYFLRKDTCDLKLNAEKILLDKDNYHIFLTNWIENPKTRNFLVEFLIGHFVSTAERLADTGKLKKPILFVAPELNAVVPEESKGSSVFLARALRKHLITFRSKAAGVSLIGDCQIWSQLAAPVRAAFREVFFGKLNNEDARIIFNANKYTAIDRERFDDLEENYCCYIWNGREKEGAISIFPPSHMHKEERYNWIQMCKKHKLPMRKYDDLVKKMREDYIKEEYIIDELQRKEWREQEQEEKPAESISKKSDTAIEKNDRMTRLGKQYLYKRAWQLHKNGISDRKIAEEIGVKSHITAKRYYEKYNDILDKEIIAEE
jgi:hypothetical protein